MAVAINKSYLLGEFELEPDSRRFARNGEAAHLARKPFGVLLYLIENRERMVTRKELLERFWEGHDVYEETLTKCIGAIRKALDDPTDNPRLIRTHWAEGYRLIGEVEERTYAVPAHFGIERTREFKITIEEEDKTEASAQEQIVAVHPKRKPVTAVLAAFVVLTIALSGLYFFRNAVRSPAAPIHSLAILPLKNLTGDAANDYLCDGMTESLIASLSRVQDLTVLARDSSFTLQTKDVESSDVGKGFGVEGVLTGSVQKNGDALRVSARLSRSDDGHVLWATEFDKPIKDIFGLQDEIARNIAVKLRPQIDDRTENNLISRPTENAAAYNLYLKGRFFWHQQTEESVNKSIEYFRQAAALDPKFVLAYCGLSDAYNALGFYFRAPNDVMPKAGLYAAKALEIDPESPDAHFSMASYKYWYERDLSGTEREAKRALELAPNHSLAHDLYGDYLITTGRTNEGLAEVERAVQLDPLAHFSNCDLAWQYYNSRQYDKAIESARQNLEMVTFCPYDHLWIGQSLGQEGEYANSVTELEKVQDHSEDWPPALAEQAYAYALLGQRAKAEETLRMLTNRSRQKFVDPFAFAVINLGLGNKEATLASLGKAVESHSPYIVFLRVDAKFDGLRDDPRFTSLLLRLGQ